jgi:hypothetical protein
MHYLLFYDVGSDYVARRQQGLVTRWRVRPWSTVAGRDAEVSVS